MHLPCAQAKEDDMTTYKKFTIAMFVSAILSLLGLLYLYLSFFVFKIDDTNIVNITNFYMKRLLALTVSLSFLYLATYLFFMRRKLF